MQHKISLLGDEDTTVLSASHQPQHWRKRGRVEEREEGRVGVMEGRREDGREDWRKAGREEDGVYGCHRRVGSRLHREGVLTELT